MNGILENIAKGIANAVAPDDPGVKLLNIQEEIAKLKVEEEKIFAEIGKKVIEAGDGEKYEDLMVKINNKKEEIKKAEEELRITKEEKTAKEKAETDAETNTKVQLCPSCSTENGAEVKFCRECGTKLELASTEAINIFCTNCGSENKSGTKFCVNCGNKFN